MMTLICPNCRHRFPAPGCCNPSPHINSATTVHLSSSDCGGSSYYNCSGLFVPRSYNDNHHLHYNNSNSAICNNSNNNNNNAGSCFINAPTIINGPAIIQALGHNITNKIESCSNEILDNHQLWKHQMKSKMKSTSRKINTCDLTGGTMTITTPSIQSGGCLIQSNDSDIDIQTPHIEIKPNLSGGGCLVQKRISTENLPSNEINFTDDSYSEPFNGIRYFEESSLSEDKAKEIVLISPPSACQELPGIRRQNSVVETNNDCSFSYNQFDSIIPNDDKKVLNNTSNQNSVANKNHISNRCCGASSHSFHHGNFSSTCVNNSIPITDDTNTKTLKNNNSSSVQIQVNATVQLQPNIGHCVVNITATTNQSNFDTSANAVPTTVKSKNNFNGGGLIQVKTVDRTPTFHENIERRDDEPSTPISWLMPLPCGFKHYPQEKDLMKLLEVKRLLYTSGWYHEGLSWQQSENLLKNAPIGRWLMRDSSDSRYTFAISVQTARGPTSVRIHYLFGRFRLDSEPRLTLVMPLFDCPIKMLEYYVEYSTMEENRREVWVDYSGQIYSQIYLTQPLVKEVRPLLHLARLVVNKNKIKTDHLPLPIKNYIAEYPHSF